MDDMGPLKALSRIDPFPVPEYATTMSSYESMTGLPPARPA